MILDKNFDPIKYIMPFQKELVQGITFLEELKNQPEDGKPILVQFQLSNSK